MSSPLGPSSFSTTELGAVCRVDQQRAEFWSSAFSKIFAQRRDSRDAHVQIVHFWMIQRAFPWLIEELQSVLYLCYIYRIKHRIEISYGILFGAS
jgi:hypothetical protein